jgi:hypothetical protein
MSNAKQRKQNREKVAAWRAKKKAETDGVTNTVTHVNGKVTSPTDNMLQVPGRGAPMVGAKITAADIALLPPSLKYQLEAVTRSRKILHLPDNLKERTENAVRGFRGY